MGLMIPGNNSSYIDRDAVLTVEVEDLIDVDKAIEFVDHEKQINEKNNSNSSENVSESK